MVSPIRPSLISASPLSGWMVNESRMRMLSPLLAFNPVHDATLRSLALLFRVGLGADCHYSLQCVEGLFCELHLTREVCRDHVLLSDQRAYPNKAQARPIAPLRVAYIRSHIRLPVENDDKKPSSH